MSVLDGEECSMIHTYESAGWGGLLYVLLVLDPEGELPLLHGEGAEEVHPLPLPGQDLHRAGRQLFPACPTWH